MAARKTTRGSPGRGRNRWTYQQKELLHVLYKEFPTFTVHQRTAIFNVIHRDHLLACGLPGGALESNSVSAQYGEHKKTPPSQDWQDILRGPVTEGQRQQRRQLCHRIRSTQDLLQSLSQNIASGALQSSTVQRPATPRKTTRLSHQSTHRATPQASASRASPHPDGNATVAVRTPSRRISDQGLHTPQSLRTITRSARRSIASVVAVPAEAQGLSDVEDFAHNYPPQPTPTKRSIKQQKRANAEVVYTLPSGESMGITQEQYEAIREEIPLITNAEAHPPLSGLLFRYTDSESLSPLTPTGFRAARFVTTDMDYAFQLPTTPDRSSMAFWVDVKIHVNRDTIATPFVSTSNMLGWIVHLAQKRARKGAVRGQITVINASALDPQSITHVPPLHRALCKKRGFSRGAHMYRGKHEFLVYNTIKADAVIASIPVHRLFDLAASDRAVEQLLRLDDFGKPGCNGYETKLLPMLKAHKVGLATSVSAMAMVARLLGLTPSSPASHIAHMVADLVQNWALVVEYATPTEWQQMAARFSQAFTSQSTHPSLKVQQQVKYAFLDGVRWGVGPFNARHSQENISRTVRKARLIGLDNPAKILADELDGAKIQVWLCDKAQTLLLGPNSSAPMLLDDSEDSRPPPASPTPGPSNWRTSRQVIANVGLDADDEIMYD